MWQVLPDFKNIIKGSVMAPMGTTVNRTTQRRNARSHIYALREHERTIKIAVSLNVNT